MPLIGPDGNARPTATQAGGSGGGSSKLNIFGASIGYDSDQLKKTYENLHTVCIADTITMMKNRTKDIKDFVDKAWVGSSAETFKLNWDKDVAFVEKNLNAISKKLEEQFNTITSTMGKKEDDIVTSRVGGV